jgi:hypothetical protein
MSLASKTGLRRSLIALGVFAAVSALLAAPASADRYRRGGGGGRHWHSQHPRVGVFVGIPPIVLIAGRPAPYYDPYERRYDRRERAYDRGYEDGYDDGYDDRAREEWRRRHYREHRHYRGDDCDY